MDDERWAEENYTELQKRFRDLWVAIVDKKVIAYGKNLAKVEEEARLKTGKIWQRKEQGPQDGFGYRFNLCYHPLGCGRNFRL